MHQIALRVCDCRFTIQNEDEEAAALVRAGLGSMLVDPSEPSPVARRYRIDGAASGSWFRLTADDDEPVLLEEAGDLLFHLDKDLTIALQLHRADLFFLHAAVLAFGDRAVVLSAPSGTGKSTLALALLENGFDYLSDELAPIDLQDLTVHAFPHALCLKTPPPAPYGLPAAALRTRARCYLPADSLAGAVRMQPLPVAAFVFLRRDSRTATACRPMTRGAAMAHLMSNALNSLAHPAAGLDAAARLSQAVPCFELNSAELGTACQVVRDLLQRNAPLPRFPDQEGEP